MNKKKENGAVISIAGIDGSGKTTLARELWKALDANGYMVELSRVRFRSFAAVHELSARRWGSEHSYINHIPLAHLAFARACDVWRHYHEEISPKIDQGISIIWDRGPLCYEVYWKGFGVEDEWPYAIFDLLPNPLLTILLDVPVEVAVKRIRNRVEKTVREDESPELLEKRRKLYLAAARKRRDVVVINADISPSELLEQSLGVFRSNSPIFPIYS